MPPVAVAPCFPRLAAAQGTAASGTRTSRRDPILARPGVPNHRGKRRIPSAQNQAWVRWSRVRGGVKCFERQVGRLEVGRESGATGRGFTTNGEKRQEDREFCCGQTAACLPPRRRLPVGRLTKTRHKSAVLHNSGRTSPEEREARMKPPSSRTLSKRWGGDPHRGGRLHCT